MKYVRILKIKISSNPFDIEYFYNIKTQNLYIYLDYQISIENLTRTFIFFLNNIKNKKHDIVMDCKNLDDSKINELTKNLVDYEELFLIYVNNTKTTEMKKYFDKFYSNLVNNMLYKMGFTLSYYNDISKEKSLKGENFLNLIKQKYSDKLKKIFNHSELIIKHNTKELIEFIKNVSAPYDDLYDFIVNKMNPERNAGGYAVDYVRYCLLNDSKKNNYSISERYPKIIDMIVFSEHYDVLYNITEYFYLTGERVPKFEGKIMANFDDNYFFADDYFMKFLEFDDTRKNFENILFRLITARVNPEVPTGNIIENYLTTIKQKGLQLFEPLKKELSKHQRWNNVI